MEIQHVTAQLVKRDIHILITAFVVCAVLAGMALFVGRTHRPPSAVPAPWPPTLALAPETLTAQSAIVYDPTDGRVLFAKNDEDQLPLASVTKIMTATAALANESPDAPVAITSKALATEGDSGLSAGETWTLGALIRYGLLVSSNDAMAAVAQSIGTKKILADMNASAKDMGLSQSYYLDPTGLDLTTGVSGAYGSARDMALLAADFLKQHSEYLEATVADPLSYRAPRAGLRNKPTAEPLLDIPGLIGAKTGYTDLAGGNLVAAFDVGLAHPLIAVVLHSTEAGRFSDMRTLIETAQRAAAGESSAASGTVQHS